MSAVHAQLLLHIAAAAAAVPKVPQVAAWVAAPSICCCCGCQVTRLQQQSQQHLVATERCWVYCTAVSLKQLAVVAPAVVQRYVASPPLWLLLLLLLVLQWILVLPNQMAHLQSSRCIVGTSKLHFNCRSC